MKFFVTGFILPKANHTENECEDAFSYEMEEKLRCAVADGATNSSYSTNWSKLLVTDYVESSGNCLVERLGSLQARWHAGIHWDNLRFPFREKAMAGDHSTLIGLSFYPSGDDGGTWEALAVGDSCLFHVRADTLIRSFPLQKSSEFNDFPSLLSSTTRNIGQLQCAVKTCKGDYQTKDLFLLATDAAARWFIGRSEEGVKPWLEIEKLCTAEELNDFILSLRKTRSIEDDDVTMLRIDLLVE